MAAAALLVLAGCAPTPTEAAPGRSVPPLEECADLEPFACAHYRSVGGDGESGPLAWLATDPLEFSIAMLNNTPTMVLQTPCNTINLPVALGPAEITPTDTITATTRGCLGPRADYESWATAFVSDPVQFVMNGDRLTLHNALGEVRFEKSSAS